MFLRLVPLLSENVTIRLFPLFLLQVFGNHTGILIKLSEILAEAYQEFKLSQIFILSLKK